MVFPFLHKFTKDGFVPSQERKALPVGAKIPETEAQRFARLLRNSEFARMVAAQGLETFEEADDFDVPDDLNPPNTPWEENFDHATVQAMHGGVVRTPDPETISRAQGVIAKAKEAYSKRSKASPALTPAPTEEPAE